MAGTRPLRIGDFGALVLAALLVCSTAVGVIGVGAAHPDGDHVTRNGDTLRIVIEDEHFNSSDRNVTVTAENGGSAEPKPEEKNGRTVYKVSVTELSKANTDLRNATVTVNGANGTLVEERENLRVLAFGNGEQTELTPDGTLSVPLKNAKTLGYADGDSVTVNLDGVQQSMEGTIEYAKAGPSLTVSLDPETLSLPVSNQATIGVSDRGKTTTVPLRKLVKDATGIASVGDETVVVTNPLFASGSDYDLVIHTEQPDARFAKTEQTNGTGALSVTNAALADAGELSVSAYQNGNPLFEDRTYSSSTDAPMTASVGENGATVKLDGNPSDAENVTAWVTNESADASTDRPMYVSVDATLKNGTVKLDSSTYGLHPNGTYKLVLTGETFLRANVTGSGNGTNGTNTLLYAPPGNAGGDGSGPSEGSYGFFGFDAKFVAGGALLFVGLVLVGVVAGIKMGGGRGGGGGGGGRNPKTAGNATGTSRRDDHTLTVVVNDGGTNGRFDGEVAVTAKKHGSTGTQESTTVTRGKGTLSVGRGRWYVTAESNGVSEQKRVKVAGDKSVTFTLGPQQAQVKVSDDDGEPLSNVAVTCQPDRGPSKTRKTDARGQASVDVPFGTDAVELSVDHEKYESATATASFDGDSTARTSLTLRRLTGGLRVTATVDGTPVSGVPVEVVPREESVRELGEGRREATADGKGVATFDGLLVGTYEIRMAVPGGRDAFTTESKRVRVRDGRTARESLDATFEYGLSRTDRDRIASIRRDVESLTSTSGRDVAVPRYYGSVVTGLLDAVERVPDEGHRFASVDADPDAVVSELLDAADESVGLISNAMTTKRNSDLFGACVDMPDQRVEWTGQFDLDALFELLAEDRKTQRQTVLQQLRRVDDRIDDERSGLAVVAPARELWERTQEFVTSERGDDPVRGAAVAFVADGLLDAVDELFDHEPLRNRLDRTVF